MPLVFQELEVPKISRQSVHEGGKVVSPKHRASLPTKRHPFLLVPESNPRP